MSGYEGFAPAYDAWAAGMTEDIDFYVELARDADGPVVELAPERAASRSRSRSERGSG
jgi:hypothetical protein